jgi:phosphoadenosine phosphosulfate reductase
VTAIELYARPLDGFEERLAHTLSLLRDAAREHAGRIVFSTSLGAEDMVLADLIARHRLPIAIATLDTGMLHAETLALMSRLESRYGLKVEVYRPAAESVLHFVREHGEQAMFRSIELRKACCGIRKMEPLARALAGQKAWITGLRREQSNARAEVPQVDAS